MLRLAIRELMVRRVAASLMALGLVTATVGFVILAGTSQTTQAVLTRDIAKAWPAPYDILVRPAGSQDSVEAGAGLVRPNYLTGLRGGITSAQVDQIRAIPGVSVAAPIANVGFTYWPALESIDLTPYLDPGEISFFRLAATSTGDAGRSTYPPETTLIAAAAAGRTVPDYARSAAVAGSPTLFLQTNLEVGSAVYKCTYPELCLAPTRCLGTRSAPATNCAPLDPAKPGRVGWHVIYPEPILVAGIDPTAEAEIAGVDRCVRQGRYLRGTDGPGQAMVRNQPLTGIPVLTSTRSFIDETVSIKLDRTTVASYKDPISTATGWQTVAASTTTANGLYQSFLPSVSSFLTSTGPLWEVGTVQYASLGSEHLRVQPTAADSAVLADLAGLSYGVQAPIPEAADVWFRPLSEAKQLIAPGSGPGYIWTWSQVGAYDPTCLPNFATTIGRMDAYTVPEVRTLEGDTLLPTRSLATYANSPPLVLTTLDGAKFFSNPSVDSGAPGEAFISAIRIRLTGTGKPSSAAESRLARVAAEIARKTHLHVDVIRGSSPRPVQIDLPAGKFGRPALTVREGWSAKGVAFRFARATSFANLILFAIALITCGLLVGQTVYTGVRQRRRELAMLHALGWPPWRVALLIELEAAIVGVAAGLLAPAISYLLLAKVNLGIVPASPLIATPLAMVVALVAAGVPAVLAARVRPVVGMSQLGRVRTSRALRSTSAVGSRNMLYAWGTEAAAAVTGLWLGASLVGALILVTLGLRGQLDTSVLGVTLAEHVAAYHYALIGITAVIGLLGAIEVLTLSYLERRPQLALLRSLGWPRPAVARLIAGEGSVIGLAAAILAVLTVVGVGLGLSASALSIVEAAFIAATVGLLLALAALLVPALMAYTTPASEVN